MAEKLNKNSTLDDGAVDKVSGGLDLDDTGLGSGKVAYLKVGLPNCLGKDDKARLKKVKATKGCKIPKVVKGTKGFKEVKEVKVAKTDKVPI